MELLPVPAARIPSPYEQRALSEIRLWQNREANWFARTVNGLNRVMHSATDLLRKVPGVDWTIDNVVTGLLRLTNEIVQDTVWRNAIYREFRLSGHPVHRLEDVEPLDLEEIDRAMEGLDAKYRALAAAEGAATGYAGAAGILPDIVSLVALNLRAAGEYATYCGFDITRPEEKLFAIRVLDAVSAPSDVAKQVSLTPVIRVSRHIARDQTLLAVEQLAVARAIRNAARALGIHLTAAKLAQVVPVTGAVVASGFNAYYTSKVCDAAHFLYRERFLQRKYGEGIGN